MMMTKTVGLLAAITVAASGGCKIEEAGELEQSPCNSPADCADDDNPCTVATCQSRVCGVTVDRTVPGCELACTGEFPGECDDGDPCTMEFCDDLYTCVYEPVEPCTTATGPIVGQVQAALPAQSDDVFFSAQFAVEWELVKEEELAELDAVPVGQCVEIPQGGNFPMITPRDAGPIQLRDAGGAVVAEVPYTDGYYGGTFAGLPLGVRYSVGTGGSAFADAQTMANVIEVPPARAQFTGPRDANGGFYLLMTTPVMPYAIPAQARTWHARATHVRLFVDYFNAMSQVTRLRCELDPAGTSITLPQAHFDAMSMFQSHSTRIEIVGVDTPAFTLKDGTAGRVIVMGTATTSDSIMKMMP